MRNWNDHFGVSENHRSPGWFVMWLPVLSVLGGIVWLLWMIVGIILWFVGIEIPLPIS